MVESAKAFGDDIKRAALIKRDSLSSLRVVTQSAFKRGEEIHYRMHYGWMEAGEVVVALTNEQTFINGRKIYHSVSTGRTKGMVDFFYKVMPDHVHLLVEVDPQYGIHRLVRELKGRSSHALRKEFPSLATRLPTLWTNSYFVSTVGGSPLAVVKQYIENQKRSER